MKSLRSGSRRQATAALGAAVVLLLGCEAIGQSKYDPYAPIEVTKEVKVSIKDGRIEVYPAVAVMRPGGKLTFSASGIGQGQTLEIDYQAKEIEYETRILKLPAGIPDARREGRLSVKGPFARVKDQPRGRLTLRPDASGNASETVEYDVIHQDAVVWKYEMALRDSKGNDLAVVDPMTVGKGEGG